ncbi:nucleotidyltransferase family protein [Alphaproteobacteria bacterium]|nr:nucleotidyltransferase family protein [Alphaproteobacteria bacterium]
MIALVLAAGLGTRLRPLTDIWPKCLMPIHGRPLLEYWFSDLFECGVKKILINTHFHSPEVLSFVKRDFFEGKVEVFEESELLGTAGTVRSMAGALDDSSVIVVHADNWMDFDLQILLDHHRAFLKRSKEYSMSMLTFTSDNPSSAGVVVCDNDGIVTEFHEKVTRPPSNIANGAVYVVEPQVVEWIVAHPDVTDFSLQVIPQFLGRIGTVHNNSIHRDIGTIESLLIAQKDPYKKQKLIYWTDDWLEKFKKNDIHNLIKFASSELFE